jgi:hypothetical protein
VQASQSGPKRQNPAGFDELFKYKKKLISAQTGQVISLVEEGSETPC